VVFDNFGQNGPLSGKVVTRGGFWAPPNRPHPISISQHRLIPYSQGRGAKKRNFETAQCSSMQQMCRNMPQYAAMAVLGT